MQRGLAQLIVETFEITRTAARNLIGPAIIKSHCLECEGLGQRLGKVLRKRLTTFDEQNGAAEGVEVLDVLPSRDGLLCAAFGLGG